MQAIDELTITQRTAETGLTSEEVLVLRDQYGENRLPVEKTTSAWTILLNQVKSPLVYIILVAAVVSLFAREYGDFAIIMAVVVIDVILGFVQEYQAQKTYTALKGLLKPTTTVLRDGERRGGGSVGTGAGRPGAAQCRREGARRWVDAGGHQAGRGRGDPDRRKRAGQQEPSNENVFMGTTVLTGRGMMQVQQTGAATELGKIATSLQEHVEEDTPLQKRLKAFSKTLTWIVAGFTLAILADRPDHGRRIPGHAAHLDHPGHRGGARGPADRRDRHPGAGHAQDPQAQRPGQAPAGGGDAWAR